MPVPAQSTHALIEWLDGHAADVSRIGGKAASLDRLAGFGFRVPPGFCLTTDAFAAQVATLPGSDRLASDPRILADHATRSALVDAMASGPLAGPVASGLAGPLDRLAGELHTDPTHPLRLAVRSSGVAEDSVAASFAGLHDTELDLTADGSRRRSSAAGPRSGATGRSAIGRGAACHSMGARWRSSSRRSSPR